MSDGRLPRFLPGDCVDHVPGPSVPKWTTGLGGRVRMAEGRLVDGSPRWTYQVAWPLKDGYTALSSVSWFSGESLVLCVGGEE